MVVLSLPTIWQDYSATDSHVCTTSSSVAECVPTVITKKVIMGLFLPKIAVKATVVEILVIVAC